MQPARIHGAQIAYIANRVIDKKELPPEEQKIIEYPGKLRGSFRVENSIIIAFARKITNQVILETKKYLSTLKTGSMKDSIKEN